jgi:hypothetical protein
MAYYDPVEFFGQTGALLTVDIQGMRLSARSPTGKRVYQISESEFNTTMAMIQKEFGRRLAELAQDRMANWLRPGGPRNIGVTGRAAENIQVGESPDGTFFVYEGESYKANFAIRHGVKPGVKVNRPGTRKGGSRGFAPTGMLQSLWYWAKARGLRVYDLDKPTSNVDLRRRRFARGWSNSKDYGERRLLFGMLRNMEKVGHIPSKKAPFDYVREYIRNYAYRDARKLLVEVPEPYGMQVTELYMNWLNSRLGMLDKRRIGVRTVVQGQL